MNAFLFGRTSSTWDPARLLPQARRNSERVRALPLEHVVEVLSRTGALVKSSPWRRAALEHLSKATTFSRPVLEETLDLLAAGLEREALLKRVSLELSFGDGFDGTVAALPKGVVLHVGAGNVFLGVVDSLVLGLLTRNVNIVKISSSGSLFPVMFARAVSACDPSGRISQAMAVLCWKGGDSALEQALVSGCDAVMVWGSDEAILSYKRMAPSKVNVIGFGSKMSAGVLLRADGPAADAAARDVAQWDQAACASPHTLYLLGADFSEVRRFAKALGQSLGRIQKGLPQGKLSDDEKVEITKARELAKVDAALGQAELFSSSPSAHWTVIAEKSPAFRVSPLNRVVYVKAVPGVSALKKSLMPFRGFIQSVGVRGTMEERLALACALAPAGIARVTELGRMLEPIPGAPHDGTYPMRELVHFLPVEGKPSAEDRLCELAEFARRRSPFHKRHLAGCPAVSSLEDFRRLPVMDKAHVLRNTPPRSRALFTGPTRSGIYFASGGSTGQPKYVFYDQGEYSQVCRSLGKALEAGGLGPGDTAANLFVAGNLWSSFLSVEKALATTQAVSVPIGSSLDMPSILRYLQEFQATALIGLPSFLLKTADAARKRRIPVRRIFFGGEVMTRSMEAFLKKCFPGASVRSAAFATADAGVVGFQCERAPRGVHHLDAASQFLEILDPDTLRPCAPGETGELFVTPLNKRLMPLLRYRLGDLGRWIKTPCACGRAEPLFELLGRCDDRIHVGGAHLFVNDLDAAFQGAPFQVVLRSEGHRERVTLRVETQRPVPQLLKSVLKHCADLAESVRQGLLPEPAVELLAPGSLERVARTGKLRRVLDLRERH
ncbi:MAG: acyl-CoA reductase [Elusimicrobiota bacterium]